MTIDRRWIAPALCMGLLLGCATCASSTSNRRGDNLDVALYPKDIQDAYKVFAVRCSRCHTLARPLNARINDPQHWVRYVARMRLNPASGINAKNGEVIIRFLQYYTHQREEERRERDGEPQSGPENESPAASESDSPPPAAEALPAVDEPPPAGSSPEANP